MTDGLQVWRDHVFREGVCAGVTPEAVSSALARIPLPLGPEVTVEWLATAVRLALSMCIEGWSDGPNRKPNRVVKAELEKLRDDTKAIWLALFTMSPQAQMHLHRFGRSSPPSGAGGSKEGGATGPRFSFDDALGSIDQLSTYLHQAALAVEQQRAKWKTTEARELRIMRAQYLAPIFEVAFGEVVTANNGTGKYYDPDPTPFMTFFEEMMRLAFPEDLLPDPVGVAKEACRLHRRAPVSFQGQIDGLA
jgi:hypothetical protein